MKYLLLTKKKSNIINGSIFHVLGIILLISMNDSDILANSKKRKRKLSTRNVCPFHSTLDDFGKYCLCIILFWVKSSCYVDSDKTSHLNA